MAAPFQRAQPQEGLWGGVWLGAKASRGGTCPVTHTRLPVPVREVCERRWLHQARISSSAPLKLGIDRGLICIKRKARCKGRVRPSPEGGGSHRWDKGVLAMLHRRHPSALRQEWPPEGDERDALPGGRRAAGSSASVGLPLAAGERGDDWAPPRMPPRRAGPHGCSASSSALCLQGIFFSARAFKVIPTICLVFLSYGPNVFPLTPGACSKCCCGGSCSSSAEEH